jgi:hypothetical protein
MLKQSITVIALVTFALTSTGCSMYSKSGQPAESAKCAKLKRELIHSHINHSQKKSWSENTAQRAEAKQRLAEANCT